MNYGPKKGYAAVTIPDFSFWGNEGSFLARESDGKGITGWPAQHAMIKASAYKFLNLVHHPRWPPLL